MIYFSELQMQGNKHVNVNSGMLKVLTHAFPQERMLVFCDDMHKVELLKHINPAVYVFSTFKYTGDKELAKSQTLKKTFREVFLAFRIFLKAKKEKTEVIVFASAFPFTALFLIFFSFIFKQRIVVCLHGDVGVLSLKRQKITTNIFRKAVTLFFKYRNSRTIALFYGEPVREKLFRLFPEFFNRQTIAIDHPYNYNNGPARAEFGNRAAVIAAIGT